ncbi:hypothetical protein FGB62_153g010 [Gracilaria domingensis]|nr:hypothetical protein FGB62_153g010 [Gracilaria domingensis]
MATQVSNTILRAISPSNPIGGYSGPAERRIRIASSPSKHLNPSKHWSTVPEFLCLETLYSLRPTDNMNMKFFVLILSLSVLAISASPMGKGSNEVTLAAAADRQFDLGALLAALLGGGDDDGEPAGTDEPGAGVSVGGDGTGTGLLLTLGDDSTFVGGVSPGSGLFFGGTDSTVMASGTVAGIGIGGDAGR